MHEPFRHRTARTRDDGQHDLGRAAEGEAVGLELEELREREPASRDAVPRLGEIRDGGKAGRKGRGRQLAGRAAYDRERGRVVLPQELERLGGRCSSVRERFGQNHAA